MIGDQWGIKVMFLNEIQAWRISFQRTVLGSLFSFGTKITKNPMKSLVGSNFDKNDWKLRLFGLREEFTVTWAPFSSQRRFFSHCWSQRRIFSHLSPFLVSEKDFQSLEPLFWSRRRILRHLSPFLVAEKEFQSLNPLFGLREEFWITWAPFWSQGRLLVPEFSLLASGNDIQSVKAFLGLGEGFLAT